MRLSVYHKTEYLYPEPVRNNVNELRLSPRTSRRQRVVSSLITILPACRLKHYEDLNLNHVHYFEITQPHARLSISTHFVVDTPKRVDYDNLPYGFLHDDLDKCQYMENCHPFLQNSSLVEITPHAWRQALDCKEDSGDVFQTSYAIMEYIFREYRYKSSSTTVSTHASDVLKDKVGVCQDFAHAMVAMCRSIKIPARYVSGYFYDAGRGAHLRGSEASHAWVEVYIDGHGWVGLDPTNNKVVDETYIVLGIGRDYKDVAPVRGTYFGPRQSAMSISVRVEKVE